MEALSPHAMEGPRAQSAHPVTDPAITIVWRRWPVVSERFGRLLGTVEVPGEPEDFEPGCAAASIILAARNARAHPRSMKLRWDAVGRRYIAPEGFPLNRLKTFRQL